MSNIYSGMTSAEKDNERKYLNNLVSGGGGNAEWAKGQLKQLDASGSSSNTSSGSSGSTSKKTQYETWESNGRTYVDGIDVGPAGTKVDYSYTSIPTGTSSTNKYGDSGDKLEYNPYQDQIDYYKNAYQDLENQIREQNRLAVEQGTNRLNAQKTNINQAADENARQAYVQYMQSQKALPQQLASQGVSGGATETANLGIQTAYQNNVNTINQNKANRIQEIDNAIVDLKNTGDLAMVEQVLANNQATLDAYTSTFDKGVSYNQWTNQFNANRQDTLADQAYREQAYKDQMTQQQWENDWFEKQYQDNKDKEEFNRVIWTVENGLADTKLAAAKLNVSEDRLMDFINYVNKAKQLELSNTQSLINNRNAQTVKTKEENAKEELGNKYYNLADSINNQYAGNTTGKKAGEAVIIDNGAGGYMINPDISRSSYLDLVIARALDSDMSDSEVKTFLNNLGINDSDISRVAAYYLK